MLEYDPKFPEQKTFIINEFMKIFDKLYDLKATGGPMFEQYARNALMLLMDDPGETYTLMEVPQVLSDKEFRHYLLAKCKNILVKEFWEKQAEAAGGEASLKNMVPYITSKFDTFISNDYMRPIIGQTKSTFKFREILDQKKIFLVNLSKGRLGEINSSLLGLIITSKLTIAAFSRVDTAEADRSDFFLYLDEFQNFATDTISTILSEARKYKLCLTISHQFIGQLEDKIRDSVFGNVGTIVSFRVGVEDSEFLAKQFAPVFGPQDLNRIENYNAYVRMLINGQVSSPFNIKTYPPNKSDRDRMENIKEYYGLKEGRDREEVEAEITQRRRSYAAAAAANLLAAQK
jgi:type IV secretory pathway TraG/TraD family ATPase VirD4